MRKKLLLKSWIAIEREKEKKRVLYKTSYMKFSEEEKERKDLAEIIFKNPNENKFCLI